MDDFPVVPSAPVLQFIADKTVDEGKAVGFIVEASDPDGTIPALSAGNLPTGAVFTDRGDGVGIFTWTPGYDQAGVYQINYVASDGVLTAQRSATITVVDAQVQVVDYAVTLEPGLNIFTYPVEVDLQHSTCLGMLNSIGDTSMVSGISRYNSQTKQIEKCNYSSVEDFDIVAGDSLMIQMKQQQTLQLNGQATCPLWLVNPGPNFVGHPNPPAGLSCFGLIGSLNGMASNIQIFNQTTGRFDSCHSQQRKG